MKENYHKASLGKIQNTSSPEYLVLVSLNTPHNSFYWIDFILEAILDPSFACLEVSLCCHAHSKFLWVMFWVCAQGRGFATSFSIR